MNFRQKLAAFLAGKPLHERTNQEITDILGEIGENLADATDEDLTEYEARIAEFTAELQSRAAAANSGIEQRRAAASAAVRSGSAIQIGIPAPEAEPRHYDASSPEYRDAWLREMAVDAEGRYLFGAPTEEMRAAYTMTTANTGEVVPTDIANEIIDLMDNDAPLLADARHSSFTRGFAIPRRRKIEKGDAAVTDEGVANTDDEENKFDQLPLDGVEIKKHIVMTRKMEIQSIDAFKNWLVRELAERCAVAEEKLLYTNLDKTDNDESSNVGMAEGNVLTGELKDEEVRKAFALLNGSGGRVVYANDSTIWNVIAGLEGSDGKKLFIPSAMDDPIVAGRIYGAPVKRDPQLADNILYIGHPSELMVNDFDPVNVMTDIDVKTRNRIFSVYALVDAGLRKPKAFVKYTHTPGMGG